MSFDVHAIVPAMDWPSFKQINEAMAARGYPAALEGYERAEESVKPVRSIDANYGLTAEQIAQFGLLKVGALVRMNGQLIEPDLSYEAINFDMLESLQATFREIDVPTDLAKKGDILVTHSGHSVADTWNAGVYLLCALILDFGGYGFELQGEAHGRDDFAAELFDALDLGEKNAPNQ